MLNFRSIQALLIAMGYLRTVLFKKPLLHFFKRVLAFIKYLI